MIRINNFIGQNKNIKVIDRKGIFTVIEHEKDISVSPAEAQIRYFMEKMGCDERQIFIQLKDNAVRLALGAMQFMLGNVSSDTGVKGVGDFFGKVIKGAVTNNSAIKPVYRG